jgi:hypothetical protein
LFYDEELYFFTIIGKPSNTESLVWQLDGHHLVISYFILLKHIRFIEAIKPITKTLQDFLLNFFVRNLFSTLNPLNKTQIKYINLSIC